MSWVPNLDDEVWYKDPSNGHIEPVRATIASRANSSRNGFEFSLLFEEDGGMDGFPLEYLTPIKRVSPRRSRSESTETTSIEQSRKHSQNSPPLASESEIVISDDDDVNDEGGRDEDVPSPPSKKKKGDNSAVILARATLVKDAEGRYSAAKVGEDVAIVIKTEVRMFGHICFNV